MPGAGITWCRHVRRYNMPLDIRKDIRIGNQTSFRALPLQPFEYAVANGFDAFEWFPDRHESGEGWDEGDIDLAIRYYIKETALQHDIAMSVHVSLQATPLKPETNGIILGNIDFAHDIGAALFNIHLQTDEGVEAYVKAIAPIIEYSATAGIRLSIENTPLTTPDDFNEMFRLFRGAGSPEMAHVGMCLDIGHANLCESTRNDYLEFLCRLDPQIPVVHLHMHCNYGDYDSHLTLFTGPAASDDSGIRTFIRILKERNFRGLIIFEQWPEPSSLLNSARERLCQMWNEK